MSFRSGVDAPDVNPLLIWGQRFMVVVLTLACILALTADRLFPERVEPFKNSASDVLAPMVAAANAPVVWGKARVAGWNAYLATAEQAQAAAQLSAENESLRQSLARTDRQLAELRANVSMPPEGVEVFRTARVVMEGDGLFNSTLVLGIGQRDGALIFDRAYLNDFIVSDPETGLATLPTDPCAGALATNPPVHCRLAPVKPNLAVVTRQGIVGTLSSVGYNASRVRLLTASDSQLSVMIGDFQINGLAQGTGKALLTLTSAEAAPGAIKIGDVVLTSTRDPDIPFQFYVGEVVALEPEIQVLPAALAGHGVPEFVQVIIKEPFELEEPAQGSAQP